MTVKIFNFKSQLILDIKTPYEDRSRVVLIVFGGRDRTYDQLVNSQAIQQRLSSAL